MLIDNAIKAWKLTKRFDSFTAVNGIDFSVHAGECFGLLGPNGAGKTSTVKMIYGFSPVTVGKLYVLGKDIMVNPREVKAHLGVVAQEDNLDPELTVRENLLVYAACFRLSREAARTRAAEILSSNRDLPPNWCKSMSAAKPWNWYFPRKQKFPRIE